MLEPGAKEWSNPDAVGCDIRYCCHDPVFLKNKKGEIILLFAKFLDTEVNFTTWCNGRDELWTRKTKDGGRTWEPAQPAGIQSGHASNDSVLLDDGTIVFASTSSELPDKYFGAVRIYLSHDDGETWEKGPILSADDGNLIREPALCLRPDGTIRMFTRTCPGSTGWGAGVKSLVSYTAESRDGGKTWTQRGHGHRGLPLQVQPIAAPAHGARHARPDKFPGRRVYQNGKTHRRPEGCGKLHQKLPYHIVTPGSRAAPLSTRPTPSAMPAAMSTASMARMVPER